MKDEILDAVDPVIEKQIQDNVSKALINIRESMQKTADAIVDLAVMLYEYSLGREWRYIRETLVNENILSDSVLKKLVPIGQNNVLKNPKYRTHIPFGYNHLYPLTQLDEKKLERLIVDGTVHQGLTVEEATRIKDQYQGKIGGKAPSQTDDFISVVVTVRMKNTKTAKSKLNSLVRDLEHSLRDVDPDVVIKDKRSW